MYWMKFKASYRVFSVALCITKWSNLRRTIKSISGALQVFNSPFNVVIRAEALSVPSPPCPPVPATGQLSNQWGILLSDNQVDQTGACRWRKNRNNTALSVSQHGPLSVTSFGADFNHQGLNYTFIPRLTLLLLFILIVFLFPLFGFRFYS